MRKIRRYIPSGNLLYVFDAAARWESFIHASDELNVTPAAVSHSIRQLEAGLGFPLFIRKHRQLILSPDGKKLYQCVTLGLKRLEETIDEIRIARATAIIKVYAPIAFGTYWLLPRLAAFPDSSIQLEVQLYNSDRAFDLPDGDSSLAITCGRTSWPGYDVYPFAKEIISPVCSPLYLEKYGPIEDLSHIAKLTLLHLDDSCHDGITWEDFLREYGISMTSKIHHNTYNNYILVIHAALMGAGIGLGWHHSIGDLLASGALVRAVDITVETQDNFYIVSREQQSANLRLSTVRNWLIDMAGRKSSS